MDCQHLKNGLKTIFQLYEIFLIDLWGVVHDGIRLNPLAMEVLQNLKKNNKKFFLISNAPRPRDSVGKFLKKLKMNEEYIKNIYTSGDAALDVLKSKKFGNKFFHLGPHRDFDLFLNFKNNKVNNVKLADYILCTGLFDEYENDLNYYKNFLKKNIKLKMICTNPDLIVFRGNAKEYCAGSVAKVFEKMGGQVIYYGKPYPEIYNNCVKGKKRVLAIGDNLNTDIKGANLMNYHSLFITSGIHKDLFAKRDNLKLDDVLKKYDLDINYYQYELEW